MLAHHFAGFFPDRQEHALAFVIAGAVLMRLAKIAERDRTVNCRQDLGQSDLGGWPCQNVATAHATLGTHEPGPLECEEDLFEVWLG